MLKSCPEFYAICSVCCCKQWQMYTVGGWPPKRGSAGGHNLATCAGYTYKSELNVYIDGIDFWINKCSLTWHVDPKTHSHSNGKPSTGWKLTKQPINRGTNLVQIWREAKVLIADRAVPFLLYIYCATTSIALQVEVPQEMGQRGLSLSFRVY